MSRRSGKGRFGGMGWRRGVAVVVVIVDLVVDVVG